MNQNPYSAPSSSVVEPSDSNAFELHEPRMVSAGRGATWVSDAFDLFKKNPGVWILICIVLIIISIILGLLSNLNPYLALAPGILNYVWVGGLMLGCREQDKNQDISVNRLFAGFQNKFATLLGLGILVTGIGHALGFASFGSDYLLLMGVGDDQEAVMALYNRFLENPIESFLLPVLISLLVYIPLVMVAWFVPALVVFHNVPFTKAMSMSFKGCLKNVIPFLINGLVFFALALLSVLTLFLAWLVLLPLTFICMYCAYKDIYVETSA